MKKITSENYQQIRDEAMRKAMLKDPKYMAVIESLPLKAFEVHVTAMVAVNATVTVKARLKEEAEALAEDAFGELELEDMCLDAVVEVVGTDADEGTNVDEEEDDDQDDED